jgi:myo-inositol-1-phosphate synthase
MLTQYENIRSSPYIPNGNYKEAANMPTRPNGKTESKQHKAKSRPRANWNHDPRHGRRGHDFFFTGVAAARALPGPSDHDGWGTIRLGDAPTLSPKKRKIRPRRRLTIKDAGQGHFRNNMYAAASRNRVLSVIWRSVKPSQRNPPRWAISDHNYVKKLRSPNVKRARTRWTWRNSCGVICAASKRLPAHPPGHIWCGSTETFIEPGAAPPVSKGTGEGVDQRQGNINIDGLRLASRWRAPCPSHNSAWHLDLPVIAALSPGQLSAHLGRTTRPDRLIKNYLAPGSERGEIRLNGWFSTQASSAIRRQECSRTRCSAGRKSTVGAGAHLQGGSTGLYGKFTHKVRINYYPPRGDNKEGWDNIDIFGWLGYPMQIKVDFLCRDSILAAPLVLDLVLFLDLAQRSQQLCGLGIQEWLSFYFKSPMSAPGLYPEHDLFIQLMKLKNTLRHLKGEELITHLGLEYY